MTEIVELGAEKMTGKEAIALSGRSESWLRNHECAWCGQTLWRALVSAGCGAIYDKRDPAQKDFSGTGRMTAQQALRKFAPVSPADRAAAISCDRLISRDGLNIVKWQLETESYGNGERVRR